MRVPCKKKTNEKKQCVLYFYQSVLIRNNWKKAAFYTPCLIKLLVKDTCILYV